MTYVFLGIWFICGFITYMATNDFLATVLACMVYLAGFVVGTVCQQEEERKRSYKL